MNILYIVTGLKIGGAERQVSLLISEMIRRGHEVSVAILVKNRKEDCVKLPIGVHVFDLNMSRSLKSIFSIYRLVRIVRDFHPDVVHSNMIHANILARMARIFCIMPRLICTAHSDIETRNLIMKIVYRLTDPLCDEMTNVSDAAVSSFSAQGLCSSRKIRRVYNAIAFADYPDIEKNNAHRVRLEFGKKSEDRIVFFSGRLELVKGCDIFAAAIIKIRALGRDDIAFVILGDGSRRAKMEGILSSINGVRFFGMVHDVVSFFKSKDIFVMPSRNEGFGIALVEAIASGMEPVVSDCAGPREIIEAVGGGRIVARDNVDELARGIIEAFDAPISKSDLNSRIDKAKKLFSLNIVSTQWEMLYEGENIARTYGTF